jgi:hypothetical protein
MLRRLSTRRFFSTEPQSIASTPEKTMKQKSNSCSILSRVRCFTSGALFASAVGMYVITFQLQGLLDEVKAAVHDVSVKQKFIDERVQSLQNDMKKTP